MVGECRRLGRPGHRRDRRRESRRRPLLEPTDMFSREVLRIDPRQVAEQIEASIRQVVLGDLRRRGAVVGMSGGIDSSVVAALCARALGRERVLGLLMPERDSSGDALRLGRMLAEQLGIPLRGGRHRGHACRPRLLRAPGRGDPDGRSRVRRRVALQDGPAVAPRRRSPQRRPARRRRSRRQRATLPHAPRRLPPDGGGHQLQAAHPDDDGVLPRRSSAVRGCRDAEPRRVRPGVLREAGGWGRRLQAHRPPLQDPGLRAGRAPRGAARDPGPAAHHGHLLAGADPGGVLLRPAVPGDGPLPVGRRPRHPGGRGGPGHRAHRGAGRARLPRHRGEATGEPLPASRAHADEPARSRVRHRRLGRAPRRDAAPGARGPGGHGRGAPPPGPGRARPLPRPARRAGACPALDHRPRHRPAAAVQRGWLDLGRLQRGDLQLRGAADRADGASATGSGR